MRVFAYFLRVQKVGRPSGRNLARTGAERPWGPGGAAPRHSQSSTTSRRVAGVT